MHSFARSSHLPRNRLRWQPYSQLSRSPFIINTPSISHSQNKNKYILSLVDQAVRTLGDIWPHNDIPSVFLLNSIPSTSLSITESLSNLFIQPTTNPQLPSPITPSRSPLSLPLPLQSSSEPTMFRSNLVPIRGFVHEVLRRSRTSGAVLQTALCYLEAIRSKVPAFLQRERDGTGARTEPDLADRIMVQPLPEPETDFPTPAHETHPTTLLLPNDSLKRPRQPSPPLPPLPLLPSPLLCPRRAFLASLILASKFTQDKCYSNRAWAKLSGLPPREIGRCERALGDALEWRLWVGKTPSSASSSASTPSHTALSSTRTVVRCHSDGDLLAGSKSALAKEWRTTSAGTRNALLRSTTLPATAFDTTSDPLPATAEENSQMYCESPDDMSTPTLTHSPSSTESSSGDRTIHMASFIDDLGANRCFDPTAKHPLSPMYHSAPPHTLANPALVFGSETYCLSANVPPMASEFGQHVFAE